MKIKELFSKGKDFVGDFTKYWHTPKPGNYIPNKEFVAYSVGGAGVQGFNMLMLFTSLAAGQRIAVVFGFDPMLIYFSGLMIAVLNILISPLRSMIIDNMRSKRGKFRPYLFWLGPPCLLIFWSLTFIPGLISGVIADSETAKIVSIIIYQLVSFVGCVLLGFYTMGMTGLIQVITPNGKERTNIMSIGALIYSMGPSVVQLAFPVAAELFYGKKGWETLGTYQWILPAFGLVFMLIGYLTYFGTKERLVVEKQFKARVKFIEGFKLVIKNKYFWIINLSTILGFGRLCIIGTQYYIAVNMLQSSALEGILTTVIATASIPGMLLAPLVFKKVDKRNCLIISYFFATAISAVMLVLSYFGYQWSATPWIFIVLIYISTLVSSLNVVTTPLISAEYMDYTQLKTGRRLDGFMGQVGGMFTGVIGMATGYILPSLLKAGGLVEGTEFSNPVVMRNAFIIWGWLSIICGILSVIPYFFYDLNETKHKKIIDELKAIAFRKDLTNNELGIGDYEEALRLGVITEEFVLAAGGAGAMPSGLQETQEAIFSGVAGNIEETRGYGCDDDTK